MCGIAGYYLIGGGEVEEGTLRSMAGSIAHRGPDGEGVWLNSARNIGLAHRRLSIIDLSDLGKQPMHSIDERYTITFNGEIYNYVELRQELTGKGYRFVSQTDTEVILALYDLKGEACLKDLNGMFAFAIWDSLKKELFCARDRFGEKPFFYYHDHEKFIFASEMKAIWAAGVTKEYKENYVEDFFGNSPLAKKPTETIYRNIKQLPPSSFLKLNSAGDVFVQQYWSLEGINVDDSLTLDDAAVRLFELLRDAVRLRLRSDVPVGSSLSGGLDSSAIVCLIDKLKPENLTQKTFSARFNNFEKDEGKYIKLVISNCNNVSDFHTFPEEEESLANIIEKIAWHQEEPFGSASIVAQWKVMQLARQNNVTVLLDGQGADESLAGYFSEYEVYLNQLFSVNHPFYKEELKLFNQLHSRQHPIKSISEIETMRMKMGRYKRRLLKQPLPHQTLKERLKVLLFKGNLQELLRYADRNSMAHSREVRLPFLDHRITEFVFTLPDQFMLRDGWTKYLLRKAMEGIVPSEICWRREKVGYEPPQKRWLEAPAVNDIIEKQSSLFGVRRDSQRAGWSNDWRLFLSRFFLS